MSTISTKISLSGALALTLLLAPLGHAGPPEPGSTEEGSSTQGEPSLAPTMLDESGGFWLGVELLGPRGAQLEAAASLADPQVSAGLPRGGRPPPGELVGRVDTLEQALAWVGRHAFDRPPLGFPEPRALAEAEPPIPGGELLREHDVVLTALVITAGSEGGGTREYPWPSADAITELVDQRWRAAELIPARAPLFAAPAAIVPPASERYLELEAGQDLWLLGLLDRCEAGPRGQVCLRWAQVLVRVGDRFRAGWLPSFQAVPLDTWIRPEGEASERRFALLESHREPGEVAFVLVEREAVDQAARLTGLRVPHAGRDWPSASVTVLGESMTVIIAGQPVLTRSLAPPSPLVPVP